MHYYDYFHVQWLLPSGDWHRTLLMKTQHWFRWWFGAVRLQAITRTSVDHKASVGHNELSELNLLALLTSSGGLSRKINISIVTMLTIVNGCRNNRYSLMYGYTLDRAAVIQNICIWFRHKQKGHIHRPFMEPHFTRIINLLQRYFRESLIFYRWQNFPWWEMKEVKKNFVYISLILTESYLIQVTLPSVKISLKGSIYIFPW